MQEMRIAKFAGGLIKWAFDRIWVLVFLKKHSVSGLQIAIPDIPFTNNR